MTTQIKARRFRLRPKAEDETPLSDDIARDVGPVRHGLPHQPQPARAAPGKDTAAAAGSMREAPAEPQTTVPAAPDTAQAGPAPLSARTATRAALPPVDPVEPEYRVASRPPPRARPAIETGTGSPPQMDKAHEAPSSAAVPALRADDSPAERERQAIRDENLTARQLRMAMRIAKRHGIQVDSAIEAVRVLRGRGIDPFDRAAMLELVRGDPPPAENRALALHADRPPAKAREAALPDPAARARLEQISADRKQDVARIQRGIARRRRRRLLLLLGRLAVFVSLPTFLVGYYFYVLATPLYATSTEFVIQQADAALPMAAGGLGGLMPGAPMGMSQDSVTVQSYLQSRGAMRRLNEEEGFKAHFMDPSVDALRRLPPDSTEEAAYRLYQRQVKIGFDPTEGVVRMEVIATSPEASERFANALVSYAEEQVDLMTARMRDNQMRDARESYLEAEEQMRAARRAAVELQERFAVLSGEVEVSMISQQIIALETELTQARLSLQDLQANVRPNPARVEPLQRRVANLESEIAVLRASMTQQGGEGTSLARIQSELIMAEAEVQTRQLLLTQALQQLESARIEANRQVRYLSLSVSPIAPDEATYPRAFENTSLAFLVFSGIYLLLSMTASILREQVSS